MAQRCVFLDTETTGLSPKSGHRVIEIGCVEMIGRQLTGKTFHVYLNPDRLVDKGAMAVHGITDEFLKDKPRFNEVIDDFVQFVNGAEIIIHNAPFDVGFLNHELSLVKHPNALDDMCEVTDTLTMARKMYPGARNSLDALTKRLNITNFSRELHGALLDSQILAQVYLAMTRGQEEIAFETDDATLSVNAKSYDLPVSQLSSEDMARHKEFINTMAESLKKDIDW